MSVFYDILKNLQTELTTLLRPYNIDVLLRRRNIWKQGDNLPVCILSPLDEETLDKKYWDMNRNTTWVYPICVNLIYPDNREQDLELDAQLYLNIREDIRNYLFVPSVQNVSGVWDVEIKGTKPFGLEDQKSTYSSTEWVLKYKSIEQRRSC